MCVFSMLVFVMHYKFSVGRRMKLEFLQIRRSVFCESKFTESRDRE